MFRQHGPAQTGDRHHGENRFHRARRKPGRADSPDLRGAFARIQADDGRPASLYLFGICGGSPPRSAARSPGRRHHDCPRPAVEGDAARPPVNGGGGRPCWQRTGHQHLPGGAEVRQPAHRGDRRFQPGIRRAQYRQRAGRRHQDLSPGHKRNARHPETAARNPPRRQAYPESAAPTPIAKPAKPAGSTRSRSG